jgi:hypothetical protein
MPAVTVENPLVLPRLSRIAATSGAARPVSRVVKAHRQREGAGFEIWRPFSGEVPLATADPFLLLDQAGPMVNAPLKARVHNGRNLVSLDVEEVSFNA